MKCRYAVSFCVCFAFLSLGVLCVRATVGYRRAKHIQFVDTVCRYSL